MVEKLKKKLLDVLVPTPSAVVEHACDGLLLKIGAEAVVVAVSHLSHDCQHRAERRQQSRRNFGALEGGTHAKLAFVEDQQPGVSDAQVTTHGNSSDEHFHVTAAKNTEEQ